MDYELPETKLCHCGYHLPVVDSEIDKEGPDGLKVGIAQCKTCQLTHFVAVGDHDLVTGFYQWLSADPYFTGDRSH